MRIYKQKSKPWITEQHFQFNPSFGPYVRFLKEKMDRSLDIRVKFYRYLIKKFQQHLSLTVPFEDVTILEQHDELIQLLVMSLVPLSSGAESCPFALAFLQPSCLFYYSDTFKKTFIEEHIEFNTKEDEESYLRYFVRLILDRCYNIKTDDTHKIIKQVKNEDGDIIKHLQMTVESSFIEVHASGPLPPFNARWTKILNLSGSDFLTAFKKFPSEKFWLEGFCMISIEDVSKEMAVAELKNAIINMPMVSIGETVNVVEMAIGELVNDSRIRIGITPFFKLNGRIVYDSCLITKGVGISSIEKGIKKGIDINETYKKLSDNPEPYIFSNIDKDFVTSRASITELGKQEIKNYLVLPIVTKKDGLLGLFELEKENISTEAIDVLQPAIPLIRDLLYYMIETLDSNINRIVKEKYTPLQPSVEWKFHEAAWNTLRNNGDDKNADAVEDIIFPDVHPLYGAIDIRDSSVERNIALKNDYNSQLVATVELLNKASEAICLPLLDSIKFKCELFINSIDDLITTEKEIEIVEFFENEVFCFFRYLSQHSSGYEKDIAGYFAKTNKHHGIFNSNLNAYEISIEKINKGIVEYLEEEVKKQQAIYNFYFEKYRTDGVEYNIYIGKSIVATKTFDPIYLKNLKLWQLTTMAHIAKLNYELQETLPLSLFTTQLILVQSQPIDICFRKDERRFDVEGSSNIRYEVLKKRIDKSRIKGTSERLTQPHTIAIIYSNASEVTVYLQHIHYLQSKKLLTEEIEKLELEDLQGVSGLKALRVGVKYD
ncbi:hypothetical protein [Segetibacter sp.]|jgi:hypothetical protein|uniref:hypothetical protein n=1 Tax=Segetibacter sp. TaxID=2231182 RepID=UPI0026130208|nr:hypothetical protein [Segetibacter sp.]MCW3080942.1 hypothetical protein [Segetibacter sp.]